MNNKSNIEKVKIDGPILTAFPNNLYIDLDGYDNIVIRINNKNIEVDKDTLAGTIMLFLSKEAMFEND